MQSRSHDVIVDALFQARLAMWSTCCWWAWRAQFRTTPTTTSTCVSATSSSLHPTTRTTSTSSVIRYASLLPHSLSHGVLASRVIVASWRLIVAVVVLDYCRRAAGCDELRVEELEHRGRHLTTRGAPAQRGAASMSSYSHSSCSHSIIDVLLHSLNHVFIQSLNHT